MLDDEVAAFFAKPPQALPDPLPRNPNYYRDLSGDAVPYGECACDDCCCKEDDPAAETDY